MRFKLFTLLTVLLLVGSNDARPSKIASPEMAVEEASIGGKDDDSSWRPIERRSSSVVQSDSRDEPPSAQRKLKDLQYMDQSLRTVATQLLNVSTPEESIDDKDNRKIANGELAPNVLLIRKQNNNVKPSASVNQENFNVNTKSDMELVKEINSEISSLESMGVGFGRPSNSKFGYFESSHPGQAMAMTEEELERELATSTTRVITAHKNRPTTTGGISTWILLNPPSTTSKPAKQDSSINKDNKELNVQVRLETKVTMPEQSYETTLKTDVQTTAEKTFPKSTTPMERITTLTKVTTPIVKKTTLMVRQPTTEKPVKSTQTAMKTEKIKTTQTASMTPSTIKDTATTPKSIPMTKKSGTSSRPTPKLKITTPRSTNVTLKPMTTKISRPNQSAKPKPTPARKTTLKPVAETKKNANTPKIEKVTFRPVQMITTPKSLIESVDRPMFVTKLKTSLATDSNSKTTSAQPTAASMPKSEETKIKDDTFKDDLVEDSFKSKPQASSGTKTNNVLKVQLKKPAKPPKIEIQSIEVNEPVLRIEKIEESNTVTQKEAITPADLAILNNSKIDLKFDFNPELTKIDVATTEAASRSSTTKRPHKRKKNKVRRRKTTTAAPTSAATSATTSATTAVETSGETSAEALEMTTLAPTTFSTSMELEENLTELGIADNSIQESKIVPESKVSPGKTKNTKKKQQLQKPIGTQIYNFLSREVMPSFGMMSLVGLGLGLASYFLYPFGGVAARRNYVVEPNYKYNLDEYGGNYGQNEEEVFSKVLQGMTNNDGKYGGIKDYESNFYRYQHYDGAYTDSTSTTRKGDPRYPTSSATNYRPLVTTDYDTKYRNTEFKYPDITTTPNYYERQKQTGYLAKNPGNGDSRFVVGNVPKEYGYDTKSTIPTTITGQTNYEREIAQLDKFGKNPVNNSPSYVQSEATKANEDYEEIVITPAAVAVEHGPRSLKNDSPRSRKKRESVIQMIPSRTEIKKEEEEIEKEEPLSNEILDIIDSVIPGGATDGKDAGKMHSEKDDENKKHETDGKAAESDKKNVTAEGTTKSAVDDTTKAADISSTSTLTTAASTSSTSTVKSLTIDEILGTTTFSKDPEDSSAEWFDHMTTQAPPEEQHGLFHFVKKIAEVKLKLGIAILKHATEGFARYLGHVQKRVNGEE